MFVQLCNAGRLLKVPELSENLLHVYSLEFPIVDYTFAGRSDFVRRVYGGPNDRGGITEEIVFETLDIVDRDTPLPPAMLNPCQRMLAARKE